MFLSALPLGRPRVFNPGSRLAGRPSAHLLTLRAARRPETLLLRPHTLVWLPVLFLSWQAVSRPTSPSLSSRAVSALPVLCPSAQRVSCPSLSFPSPQALSCAHGPRRESLSWPAARAGARPAPDARLARALLCAGSAGTHAAAGLRRRTAPCRIAYRASLCAAFALSQPHWLLLVSLSLCMKQDQCAAGSKQDTACYAEQATHGGAMHRTCHVRCLCCRSLQAAALPSSTLLRCDKAAGASKLAGTRHIAGSKKVHTGR